MVTLWGTFSETAELFHSHCTVLHSQQQCTRVSVAFHPCHHPRLSSCISLWLWFAFFHWLMRMSTFSCVFDHLHIFFRELFRSSAHFKIVLSFCCWVVRVLHVRWTLDLYQTYDQQIFPVILWVVFAALLFIAGDHSVALLVLICSALWW